jgi:hypothetical protein
MKTLVLVITILTMIAKSFAFAQTHRIDRYEGPIDGDLGLKAIGFGALIWLVGMVILKSHKKNERGAVKNSNAPSALFGVILAVIGGLTFFIGLMALGF